MKTPCTDSYSQQQKEEKLRRDTTKHHKQNTINISSIMLRHKTLVNTPLPHHAAIRNTPFPHHGAVDDRKQFVSRQKRVFCIICSQR